MELEIHQYSVKVIKWPSIRNGRIACCKYYGEPLSETEDTITVKYNRKPLTLRKDQIFIDYELRTDITPVTKGV